MLPKYKYLLTYRYSEIIYDLTVEFTQKYILGSFSNLGSKPDYRTADQMVQAARSGKQNIIEGVGQSRTSKKGEIKLLGVANASLEELLADYEDFLRLNKLDIWQKSDPRVTSFRSLAYRLTCLSNLSDIGYLKEKPIFPKDPQEAANFLLTLCHQAAYLLSKQILACEARFVTKGGYTENLFKKRLKAR